MEASEQDATGAKLRRRLARQKKTSDRQTRSSCSTAVGRATTPGPHSRPKPKMTSSAASPGVKRPK
eukprot:7394708-Lingulodinium_polyedra.AAC.1